MSTKKSMGKRKSRKISIATVELNSPSPNQSMDISFSEDSSTGKPKLKVLHYYKTENKDKYLKWTKTCYTKNIALVHPSILRDLGCSNEILIRGDQSCSLYFPMPFKCVKDSTIVLMSDKDFTHEELVSVHCFDGDISEAKQIFITSELDNEDHSCLENALEERLSNQFVTEGCDVKFKLLDEEHKCTVSAVLSTATVMPKELPSVISCSQPYSSTPTRKTKNEELSDLTSLFSSMTLEKSIDQGHAPMDIDKRRYYTTNHKTSIVINNLSTLQDLQVENSKMQQTSLGSKKVSDKDLFHLPSTQELETTLPSTADREEFIKNFLKTCQHNYSSDEIVKCSELSQGLTLRDLLKVLKFEAPLLALIRTENTSLDSSTVPELKFSDVVKAIKKKRSSLSLPHLKTEKVTWNDIGGMREVKEKLREEIELSQNSNFKRYGIAPTKGILLYGPPGCSKTMIVKALATECHWNFISKKASEIMKKYVGESEKAVTHLFREAKTKSPCIIFLDEIDALAPERSSSFVDSGVQNRIVNCLLTEMSGIETLKDVIVIAATNFPEAIDPALLRQGRIGHHIYVPLPDLTTRKEILKLSMKKRTMSDDKDFEVLSRKTEGYSGAEIVNLCNEVAWQLLQKDPDCDSPVFQLKYFESALLSVLPRTDKKRILAYERFSSK